MEISIKVDTEKAKDIEMAYNILDTIQVDEEEEKAEGDGDEVEDVDETSDEVEDVPE